MTYIEGFVIPVPTANKDSSSRMPARAMGCSSNTARSA